jgi:urease accessory protein
MTRLRARGCAGLNRPVWTVAIASLGVALLSEPVLAHPGHGNNPGFLAGALHPIFGLDHLLAMVCVGVLSAQLGRKTLWLLPAVFVGVMALGGLLGMAQVALPRVELAIAFSVFCLGVAIVADQAIPLALAAAGVGLFALFHGNAHGLEMPSIAQPWLYSLGFLVSTAALHFTGVGIGLLGTDSPQRRLVLRGLGVGVVLAGLKFMLA